VTTLAPSARIAIADRKLLETNGFRPDIQGLRAIAVAMVVTYHLFPSALPGGFAGVDVFFVISGCFRCSVRSR
jgi:peptidoglycan/LPS O-acetylase OafA/YrhL